MPAKKPPVKLRSPPTASRLEGGDRQRQAAESFVQGKPPPLGRGRTLYRNDGRVLRRLTVYLPADLAHELSVHCAREEVELSAAIASMVAAELERAARGSTAKRARPG
jgi:hypothetical protein